MCPRAEGEMSHPFFGHHKGPDMMQRSSFSIKSTKHVKGITPAGTHSYLKKHTVPERDPAARRDASTQGAGDMAKSACLDQAIPNAMLVKIFSISP